MKRRILVLCLTLAMALSLAACGGDGSENGSSSSAREPGVPAANLGEVGSWGVYWYLCGSDLETNGGFAIIPCRSAGKRRRSHRHAAMIE